MICLAKLSRVLSLRIKDLNTIAASISYIHTFSIVKCYIMRLFKLSIATALAANNTMECQIRIKNLNSMVNIYSGTTTFLLVGEIIAVNRWSNCEQLLPRFPTLVICLLSDVNF